jgi:hypothetical protein
VQVEGLGGKSDADAHVRTSESHPGPVFSARCCHAGRPGAVTLQNTAGDEDGETGLCFWALDNARDDRDDDDGEKQGLRFLFGMRTRTDRTMSNIQDGRSGRPPSAPTLRSDSAWGHCTGTRRGPTVTSGGNQQQAYSQPSPIRTRKTPSANVTHAIRGQRPVRHGTVRDGGPARACAWRVQPRMPRHANAGPPKLHRERPAQAPSQLSGRFTCARPTSKHAQPAERVVAHPVFNLDDPCRAPRTPATSGVASSSPRDLPPLAVPSEVCALQEPHESQNRPPPAFRLKVSNPVLAHRSPLPGGATPRCIVTPVLP